MYDPSTNARNRRRIKKSQLHFDLFLRARLCRLDRQNLHLSRSLQNSYQETSSEMKPILQHLNTCKRENDCLYPHCSDTCQLIIHWSKCRKRLKDCHICRPKDIGLLTRDGICLNEKYYINYVDLSRIFNFRRKAYKRFNSTFGSVFRVIRAVQSRRKKDEANATRYVIEYSDNRVFQKTIDLGTKWWLSEEASVTYELTSGTSPQPSEESSLLEVTNQKHQDGLSDARFITSLIALFAFFNLLLLADGFFHQGDTITYFEVEGLDLGLKFLLLVFILYAGEKRNKAIVMLYICLISIISLNMLCVGVRVPIIQREMSSDLVDMDNITTINGHNTIQPIILKDGVPSTILKYRVLVFSQLLLNISQRCYLAVRLTDFLKSLMLKRKKIATEVEPDVKSHIDEQIQNLMQGGFFVTVVNHLCLYLSYVTSSLSSWILPSILVPCNVFIVVVIILHKIFNDFHPSLLEYLKTEICLSDD